MRIKNLNNTAFSLLEVLLASIIFIISITGVFVTLTAVRRPVADKESALAAAVFGKQVLESLRSSVDAGTFYNATSSRLSLGGSHQVSVPTGSNLPQGTTAAYWVTCADGSNPCNPDSARMVQLNITWPDAQ